MGTFICMEWEKSTLNAAEQGMPYRVHRHVIYHIQNSVAMEGKTITHWLPAHAVPTQEAEPSMKSWLIGFAGPHVHASTGSSGCSYFGPCSFLNLGPCRACGNELMRKKECEEGQDPRQSSRRQWWGSRFWARKQESQHWLESWCYRCKQLFTGRGVSGSKPRAGKKRGEEQWCGGREDTESCNGKAWMKFFLC